MSCDFPFGLNVAISNVTMLQVEYCGDRIRSDRIHNKACSLKSFLLLVLQGGPHKLTAFLSEAILLSCLPLQTQEY